VPAHIGLTGKLKMLQAFVVTNTSLNKQVVDPAEYVGREDQIYEDQGEIRA
jgi:hypothetical protein